MNTNNECKEKGQFSVVDVFAKVVWGACTLIVSIFFAEWFISTDVGVRVLNGEVSFGLTLCSAMAVAFSGFVVGYIANCIIKKVCKTNSEQ